MLNDDEVLISKDVDADGKSRGGFVWPLDVGAIATVPDGKRFGGRLWGNGPLGHIMEAFPWTPRTWLALIVHRDDIVMNNGWATFTHARVAAVGDHFEIGRYIESSRPGRVPALFGTVVSADEKVPAVAGYGGRATSGNAGQSVAGFGGRAVSGAHGQSIAGVRGAAVSRFGGLAVSGPAGVSGVGEGGTAVCDVGGIVSGGANAFLVAKYEVKTETYPFNVGMSTGRVGHNGIKPDVWYEGSPSGLVAVADGDPRVAQEW